MCRSRRRRGRRSAGGQQQHVLAGHVDKEFPGRAPVEGHLQPERPTLADAGGDCPHTVRDDQGRTGRPPRGRPHQGGRREAQGLLPVFANPFYPVCPRHSVQTVPADGMQQV
uniref:(northern house mosquito) hypothetical protein n=1 Tax=Culex pipiens TaxID=7175 RepID=A0A8D8PJK0_CULPI